MKKISFIICLLFFAVSIKTMAQSDTYLEKVQTLDSTIKTLYSVISGEKGVERDWKLFRYLFKPQAKLIPSGMSDEGVYKVSYLSPDDYIKSSGKWLVDNGFFEKEIARSVHTFKNITQVFSSYEAFRSEADTAPFMSGINSIQLLNDGKRWWIVNIYWAQANKEHPIPKEFLKN